MVQSAAVVFTAASLSFALLHAAPGDAASALGEGVSPEFRATIRAQYGLDQSLATQYGRWIGSLLQGDFGWSLQQRRPVVDVLADAIPNSLILMGLSLCLSLLGGIAVGAWQGSIAESRRDRVTSVAMVVVYSLPEFWLALALMTVFAQGLGWLPATGATNDMYAYLSPGNKLLDRLRHLVLPVTSLSCVGISVFARYQRNAMSESMQQPFVAASRVKGLTERAVQYRAWRTATLPLITLVGLLLPSLFTGAVFVERVFSWPGMGYAITRAIEARDFPVVSAGVIVGSVITSVGALCADMVRTAVDPRLRRAGPL